MATLNPQVPLEARQTVLDQVVAGASFTAYEITLEVRRRLGATVEVPHGVVNSIVQAMFSNGEIIGYDRAPDTSVKAATPPFRYSPRTAGRGAARTTPPSAVAPAPAFIGVNRANLPISLRYWNPVAATIRAYTTEARAWHDAAGVGDTPFKVWLPTAQDPKFRVRSYGAAPTESEVQDRYSLSPSAKSHLGSKAAFSYADEFRITTFENGTAKTYRAALDMTLVGTVTKDGEVPTKQANGVEIEVPVKASDLPLNVFGREAAGVFAYFRVAPTIQGGVSGIFKRPNVLLAGTGWRITDGGGALALVEDVAFSINTLFLPHQASLNLELDFASGDLAISGTGESLDYTSVTREALARAFTRLESEASLQIEERIKAEPNVWRAKILWAQLSANLGNFLQGAPQKIEWKGIQIEDNRFDSVDANETTIRPSSVPATGTGLRTQRVAFVAAQANTVVFFNDLGTRTGSPSRLRQYFAAHPNVQRAYVLTFVSDAAKKRFIADNHFESVPTQLLSSLPKAASSSSHGSRTLNRIPFDASQHAVRAPRHSLLAAFPALNDAGFADVQQWVLDSRFDGKHWPDFKRLYKKAEARLWPLQNRSRWDKTEADLPANTPLADEREAFLLGVLIGHLDSAGAERNEDRKFPHGGPTAKTVAYMVRRASRLLCFLRDEQELSEERRALLAPLVAGSMVRPYCGDIQRSLAFRLGLENDVLVGRPDLVQRIWSDSELAIPVLRWAFDWLRAQGQAIEGTPRHVRRFIEAGDEDAALTLLPGVLESGAQWGKGYSHADLARELQTNLIFEVRRGEVLRLFARFPLLQASEQWIWSALNTPQADEPEIVRFVTPLVEARARRGEWEAVVQLRLAPALRTVFLNAFANSRPRGMTLSEWHTIGDRGWVELLFPALQAMEMSPAVAQFLWEASGVREEWIRLGGEKKWVEAFTPVIRDKARDADFEFAAQLPPLGQSLFFQELTASYGDAIWAKLGALDSPTLSILAPNLANVPLSDAFWKFVDEAPDTTNWIDLVGRERATPAFGQLSVPVVRSLLEARGSGLEPLIEAWLRNNASQLPGDEPLLMLAATNLNEGVRAPALARLRQASLNLRVALRLIESGLPEAQALGEPYFENEGDDWTIRALALVDSPVAATRAYGLGLLARFASRWTPDLLRSLAQHDDARVQAFVATRLEGAPEVAANEAITVFDCAIINSRGRSRRAKMGVQRRLTAQSIEEETNLEALLDAARNGAPRDRAWALKQLVRLQLRGAEVPDLQLNGAVARSSS